MTLGAEDARGIEALMRFEKKRGYNRPIVHLNRHAVMKNLPDEGVFPVRCNIRPGEDLDREPLTREHQQIERQSGEVFTKAEVLPRRDHEDIDIGVRPIVSPRHGTEEDDLLYCVAARRTRLCREFMDDRPPDREHTTNTCERTVIMIADRTVPGEEADPVPLVNQGAVRRRRSSTNSLNAR